MEQQAGVLGAIVTRRRLNFVAQFASLVVAVLVCVAVVLHFGIFDRDRSPGITIGASTLREIETERLLCVVAVRGGRVEAMGCVRKGETR